MAKRQRNQTFQVFRWHETRKDDFGQPEGDWLYAMTVRGRLETLSGRDYEFARQQVQDCTHRMTFTTRVPSGLTKNLRLRRGDRQFTVTKVFPDKLYAILTEETDG